MSLYSSYCTARSIVDDSLWLSHVSLASLSLYSFFFFMLYLDFGSAMMRRASSLVAWQSRRRRVSAEGVWCMGWKGRGLKTHTFTHLFQVESNGVTQQRVILTARDSHGSLCKADALTEMGKHTRSDKLQEQ